MNIEQLANVINEHTLEVGTHSNDFSNEELLSRFIEIRAKINELELSIFSNRFGGNI